MGVRFLSVTLPLLLSNSYFSRAEYSHCLNSVNLSLANKVTTNEFMSDRLEEDKKYFQASVRGNLRSNAQYGSLIDLEFFWSCLRSSREFTKYKGFVINPAKIPS